MLVDAILPMDRIIKRSSALYYGEHHYRFNEEGGQIQWQNTTR